MRQPSNYIDLFDLVNNAEDNTDAKWGGTEELLESFFSKTNTPALPSFLFYILDFVQKKYLAVGPGVNTFLGYSADYLKDGGPLAYFDLWHGNDWKTYNNEIFSDHANTLKGLDADVYKNLLLQTNYRVKTRQGDYYTLAQQSSYIDVSPDGIPLGVIGIVTDITPYKQDTKMTYNITAFDREGHAGKVLLNKYYFPDAEDGILSKREIEILKWICEGLSTKQIASKLSISPYTVNNHRINILQKTNSRNFAQVLRYAITNGVI